MKFFLFLTTSKIGSSLELSIFLFRFFFEVQRDHPSWAEKKLIGAFSFPDLVWHDKTDLSDMEVPTPEMTSPENETLMPNNNRKLSCGHNNTNGNNISCSIPMVSVASGRDGTAPPTPPISEMTRYPSFRFVSRRCDKCCHHSLDRSKSSRSDLNAKQKKSGQDCEQVKTLAGFEPRTPQCRIYFGKLGISTHRP